MHHTVLARKWRPKKFADLIGQQNSVKILTNIIIKNRLHHAYLLTGTRGVGKTTIARIIAKALNCLNLVQGEPCTSCENCLAIDNGSFVDVIEIDAASNTGVDNIRELIDNACYSPSSGRYKVYIIDEVHMLSKSAFNAMLKTLEEPPEHVIFILATTDLQKVPATILSRCLQLKLRNLSASEISQYLASVLNIEQVKYEIEALPLIANAANGSMRDALSILDQAIAFSSDSITSTTVSDMLGLTHDNMIYNLLDSISTLDGSKLMGEINAIHKNSSDLESVLLNLQQKLCSINLAQLGIANCLPELSTYIDKFSVNDVQLYFEIANLGIEQLQKVRDKYPTFVMTMLRMLAFHIGSNEEKTITLQQNNFKVTTTSINQIPDKIIPENLPPNIQEAKVIEDLDINTTLQLVDNITDSHDISQDVTKQIFDGNWFNLIIHLKDKLGLLYAFVENAKLKNHTDSGFELIIDERYQSALNQKLISQLEQVLSDYMMHPVSVNIEFASGVGETLKEKKLLDNEQKQLSAEQDILNDEYLIQVCGAISAKIMPGSIKPI
jgi:DNA polymerase-3 subunit gamma/tau